MTLRGLLRQHRYGATRFLPGCDQVPDLAKHRFQDGDSGSGLVVCLVGGGLGQPDRLPDLYAEIRQTLQAIDVDLDNYPLPEPRQADEPNGVLFDSAHDYADQLTYYEACRNGHNAPTH